MENLQDVAAKAQEEAVRLLHTNLTPHGILAASASPNAKTRGYTYIFGRDAGVCALAMVLSNDPALIANARESLLTLAAHQAANGQIPKYVDPDRKEPDFWYLGCIDATLWWLIALKFFTKHHPAEQLDQRLQPNIDKALVWLHCQEHPRLFLLQQNEASDWADIMPRSGFVLYSNALWFYVKKLYQLPGSDDTKFHFNHLFFPFSQDLPEYRRLRLLMHYVRNKTNNENLYLSFVNFSFWGEEGDVFGNLLAILFGLADNERANLIIDYLLAAQINIPYPVRVTCTPILQDNPLWRTYMGRHKQNFAYQYHNAGIWPFVGGFWVLALKKIGRHQLAAEEWGKLATTNSINNWDFNEWFHGSSGQPTGMSRQSWNAAMLLLAYQGLTKKVF